MKNIECWSHSAGKPVNVDIVKGLYKNVHITKDGLILPSATTGDLNFLRMLATSQAVFCNELINNSNRLSFGSPDEILESNSSWFDWSRNTHSCYGCDYCVIKQIPYLKDKNVEIGCDPKDLVKYLRETDSSEAKPMNKLSWNIIGYNDVRTAQPCLAKQFRNT
jgi:hypothetical protein